MCAAKAAKDTTPRSAHTPGRVSRVRSSRLDSTGSDPFIETPSLFRTITETGMFPHDIAPGRISDFVASAAPLGSFFMECGGSPPLLWPKLYLNILVRAPGVEASAPTLTVRL